MNIKIISCGIFKDEINNLIKRNLIHEKVIYLDSILHIYPDKLKKILDNQLKDSKDSDDCKIVIVYGDCHAYMIDQEKENKNIIRTPGINCCEIIMGTKEYHKYRKEGAFFFMPEWCERWQEVFKHHLGLEKDNAALFMKDMHTKLVYLDTGIKEIPLEKLKEASRFLELNYEIYKIDLSILANTINECIEKIKK